MVRAMCARTLMLSFAVSAALFSAPIVSFAATSEVITSNTTFAPGEYFFDSLTIASSSTLTLQGNPDTPLTFKGVIIHAQNMIVEKGSFVSAYAEGYSRSAGPGAPTTYQAGASYGGLGNANAATTTYGSALYPTDLGSGSYQPGGGAIRLIVADTFTNDGIIGANGGQTASGGSINVETGVLTGSGIFEARGGGVATPGYYVLQGGGGRIAVRYASSTFAGLFNVSGGCGSPSGVMDCAEGGTIGLINTTTDTLYLPGTWRFQSNDSPVLFAHIVVTGRITSDSDMSISAKDLTLADGASVSFGRDVHLNVSTVTVSGGSELSFSGSKDVAVHDLTISGTSQVTTLLGQALDLSLDTLAISLGSLIHAAGKGYGINSGPGAPVSSYSGASYGGVGYANTATSTYGDPDNPTDFGSGAYGPGGGVLNLTISGTLANNGEIMASGMAAASGGSILIKARTLTGSGFIFANGGGGPAQSLNGPGGGGRVAIYTESATSTFSGVVGANGACNYNSGYRYCAGNGTVVFKSASPQAGPKVSNVLFLPGIEGSRLYEGTGCGKLSEEKLWEPASSIFDLYKGDERVGELGLNGSGESVCSHIYAKEGDLVGGIYDSFESTLDALKSDGTIANWEPVAYDWRLSLDDLLANGVERGGTIHYEEASSTPYIEQTLRHLAASSKTGKVTIIAHSNGGMVAKALLNKLGTEASRLVDTVVLVASPQSGTPADLGSLLVGYDAGVKVYGFLQAVSNEAARTFSQNAPMAYHLLPSKGYLASIIDELTHPVIHFSGDDYAKEIAAYGNSIVDLPTLDNFLLATANDRTQPSDSDLLHSKILNPVLIEYGNRVHAALDAWTPPTGIEVDQIAGWGIDTVGGIDFYTPNRALACVLCASQAYRPILIEDGDGTVVVPSALEMASSTQVKRYWVNLYSSYKDTKIRHTHADFLEIPQVQDLIRNIIGIGTSTLPAYVQATPPAPSARSKKLIFFLHSPLTLQLTDASGNVTGLTQSNTVTEDIPGSAYGKFGDVKYLIIPEGEPYTLTMHGQATGAFSLDVQEMQGSAITASTTIAAVPTTASTTVSMDIGADFLALSPLLIDENGDGTTDAAIKPTLGGTTLFKNTPPDLRLSFSTMTKALSASGVNVQDPIAVTATSVTARDVFGNSTSLVYTKQPSSHHNRIVIRLKSIVHNGVTTRVPATTLTFSWTHSLKNPYHAFESVMHSGATTLTARYESVPNRTIVTTNTGADKKVVPGLVIPYIETMGTKFIIGY